MPAFAALPLCFVSVLMIFLSRLSSPALARAVHGPVPSPRDSSPAPLANRQVDPAASSRPGAEYVPICPGRSLHPPYDALAEYCTSAEHSCRCTRDGDLTCSDDYLWMALTSDKWEQSCYARCHCLELVAVGPQHPAQPLVDSVAPPAWRARDGWEAQPGDWRGQGDAPRRS